MIKIDHAVVKGKFHTVFLENGDKIRLPEFIVFKHSVFSGKQFADDRWDSILRETSRFKCHEKMMSLLSRRAYTEWKLTFRLRRGGFPKSDIDYSIEQAKATNLINDIQYARDFIEEKRRAGRCGKQRIILDLRRHGVNSELITEVFDQLETNHETEKIEFGNAEKLAQRKWQSLAKEQDLRKKKAKLLRHLVNKGFTFDMCYQIINGLTDERSTD